MSLRDQTENVIINLGLWCTGRALCIHEACYPLPVGNYGAMACWSHLIIVYTTTFVIIDTFVAQVFNKNYKCDGKSLWIRFFILLHGQVAVLDWTFQCLVSNHKLPIVELYLKWGMKSGFLGSFSVTQFLNISCSIFW